MKRLIAGVLVALVAAPACAEWVRYGGSDTAIYYYDPATIKKRGNFVRVWSISDAKRRDSDGVLSRRWLYEHDCAEDRVRILSVADFSENMANGKVVLHSFDSPSEWFYIPPGSVGEILQKILCKK